MTPTLSVDESVLKHFHFLPPQAQEVVSRLLASGYKLVPASEWDDQIHQPAPGLSGPPAGTAPRQLRW